MLCAGTSILYEEKPKKADPERIGFSSLKEI
jgi:hypothetical protein